MIHQLLDPLLLQVFHFNSRSHKVLYFSLGDLILSQGLNDAVVVLGPEGKICLESFAIVQELIHINLRLVITISISSVLHLDSREQTYFGHPYRNVVENTVLSNCLQSSREGRLDS